MKKLAVEKMKLLSIVGKEEKMNTFIADYLLDSGLQPENALKVLDKGWKLSSVEIDSQINKQKKQCQMLFDTFGIPFEKKEKVVFNPDITNIRENLEEIQEKENQIEEKIQEMLNKQKEIQEKIIPFQHLQKLDMDLKKLYDMQYIKFRFGKMPIDSFQKIKQKINAIDAILFDMEQEGNTVWVIYFTTKEYSKTVDSYFKVLKFERIWLPDEVEGKPKEFIQKANSYLKNAEKQIEIYETQKKNLGITQEKRLIEIANQLEIYERINKVKKYIAHDNKGSFYIVGWIPESELKPILTKLKKEKEIKYDVKEQEEVLEVPPTHLKNPKIIKPFESLIEMYGLPNYKEMDPTFFVAITAFIMFGFMFGDVGQGACILLLGFILKKKKVSLGPVFSTAGISSILFGFLYGSVFGKEDILPSILIRPMENINTMLIAGIAVGAIFILMAMLLNIRNGIKNKDKTKIFLSENGLPGLIFYGAIMAIIAYFVWRGKLLISGGILILVLGIPLLIILLKNPLSRMIEKQKGKPKSSIIETLFEMFETLLSFASNSISFIRIAAFAINHVGLCMAIYILADMTTGAGNIVISIIGNGIVIGLEGLIVAIQVLRLEYYELFSRFYQGDGREYKPLREEVEE